GAVYALDLPAELLVGLNRLSRRHDATLFMTLAAAFNVLLYRHSGQSDLCIGYPAANRPLAEPGS
uniref:hypothetical protein n=1 Tax=Methylogaea oryzae TaxID=1295382 RepID=UPI00138F2AA4